MISVPLQKRNSSAHGDLRSPSGRFGCFLLSICADGANAEAAGVDNAEQLFNSHCNPDGRSGNAAVSEGRPAARDPHGFVDFALSRKREKAQSWKMLDSCIDLTGSRKGDFQNTADPQAKTKVAPPKLAENTMYSYILSAAHLPRHPATQGLRRSLSLSLSL